MKALLLTFVVACGSAPPPPPPVVPAAPAPPKPAPYRIPTRTQDVAVAVGARGVTINGARLGPSPTVESVEKLLGPADRVEDLPANILHTWDKLGILVYEPHDGRAQTLGFVYTTDATSYHPKLAFAGRLSIDGQPPGHATTDVGATHVYVGRNPDDSLDVVELSFDKPDTETEEEPSSPRLRAAERACNAGDAKKCTAIAIAYQNGTRGVQRDEDRAFAFATKACDRDDAFGCVVLGVLHDTGRGTAVSRDHAAQKYAKACRLGESLACKMSR